jgi:NADH-quinone oxidoreductase subunit E
MTQAAAEPDARGAPVPDEVDPKQIRQIVATHREDRGGLIALLQAIQMQHGYLPEDALRMVAEETGRSLVDIYGAATFYRSFTLQPRGRHLICACLGTACHVRGAPRVVEEFERQLGVKAGETTADNEFTLETVNCLGACALGPIVVVDGRYFCNVRKFGVADILEKARRGVDETRPEDDETLFPLEVNCPRCNHGLMDRGAPVDGLPSIRVTVDFRNVLGPVNLSSLYGSFHSAGGTAIPEGAVCEFFCPHCHGQLGGPSRCTECGAPMIPMVVRGGGMVQICARRGCRGHRLDLDGVNA